MEFNEVIRKRRMVREFTTEPLAPGVTERVLAAANRAPSAGFSQGYALLVLDQPAQLAPFWELAQAADEGADESDGGGEGRGGEAERGAAAGLAFPGLTNAPLVIVPLSCKDIYLDRYARQDKGWTDRDESRWPVPYWDIDTGFMALLMLLDAVDEGLGALFFGIMPAQIPRLRGLFGVPDAYQPIGAVAIGHPDPAADHRGSSRVIGRRSLDQLVHRGRW